MTVNELIEQLQKVDKDLPIIISHRTKDSFLHDEVAKSIELGFTTNENEKAIFINSWENIKGSLFFNSCEE